MRKSIWLIVLLCFLAISNIYAQRQWHIVSKWSFYNSAEDMDFFPGSREGLMTLYDTSGNSWLANTVNGGQTWQINTDINRFPHHVQALSCVNSKTAYAAGLEIYKSRDGGQTWDSVPNVHINGAIKRDTTFSHIHFMTEHTGVGSFMNGNVVYMTHDGGCNWNSVYKASDEVEQLNALDSNHIYGRTIFYTIFYSSDGGKTWAETDTTTFNNAFITKIAFKTIDTGYVAAGYIFRTTNGGKTWALDSTLIQVDHSYISLSSLPFSNIQFPDSHTIVLSASLGQATLSSTDNGVHWLLTPYSTFERDSNLMIVADASQAHFFDGTTGAGISSQADCPIYLADSMSGIQPAVIVETEAAIYPNPAHDKLNISARSDIKAMRIYNLLGQAMYAEGEQHSQQAALDIARLPKGAYIIEIRTGNAVESKRFLVE